MSNVPTVIKALTDARFAIETVAHLNGLENELLPASEIVGAVIDKLHKLAPELPRPDEPEELEPEYCEHGEIEGDCGICNGDEDEPDLEAQLEAADRAYDAARERSR